MRHSRVERPFTRRRVLWLFGLAAAATLATVSSAGATRTPVPNAGKFTPAMVPLGVGHQQTTVVVQLAGDPVTVADADAANPLTSDQKRSLRDQLRQKQAPVEQQIQSLGGHVLATYQSAYNGIKVRIAADQAAQLASVPGVVDVHPVRLWRPSNVHGVPLVGAPQVWDGLSGLHGEGIKVADIDTGIDYTHADFGGSGNPADYQSALASDTLPANPLWFGPSAPKVKGGVDLVGDTYQPDPNSANYQPTPQPDPNPLDCNSHGTHTAGTIAGFGVLADGSQYTGPYNASTIAANSWLVGPGVAPKADIYSVKVFGCNGPTDEVIDAIEWAVDHDMDVINMSLGSPFGSPDSPDAVAAENAAKDGVIVVASSGNEGPSAYMTGSPASGNGVISVAANDPTQSFPGAVVGLTKADTTSGGSLTAIDANGAALPAGSFPLKVIPATAHDASLGDGDSISLGCSAADIQAAGDVTGAFVVVERGTCARVAKAMFGQQAGAAGVIMINNSGGYPPFEGPITHDPDPPGPPLFGGFDLTVTIPFLGVQGGSPASASAAGAQLLAADGGTLTLTSTTLTNPSFLGLANFSSWGPRSGDSFLKPNVTAPGVSIASAGMGTGNGPQVDSGTSMSAPHTSGTAALVKQAHPDWRRVEYWEAAIENTADPGGVASYATRGAGTGLIQALPATQTQVVALGDGDMAALSYGFAELDRDFSKVDRLTLRNFGSTPATFDIADSLDQGSPHTVSLSDSSVTVPPHGSRDVRVALDVPVASAGGGSQPGLSPFNDVAGVLTLTPAAGSNNGVTLRVPYYLVPQAVSHVQTRVDTRQLGRTGTATAVTSNFRGAVAGNADWYAWGLKDGRDRGLHSDDIRAVGVSSFPDAQVMQFAISTNHRWSNATEDEFDVYVDVNNDGTPDYDVVAADLGALTTGEFNGQAVVAVFDLATGGGTLDYFADAPTDSSTIVMPVDFSLLCDPGQPCLGATSRHFTYSVTSFSETDGTSDQSTGTAVFNPFTPAVSTGMFDTVPPGGSATEALTVNRTELAQSPALGWMVVTHENPSGGDEAQLVPLNLRR